MWTLASQSPPSLPTTNTHTLETAAFYRAVLVSQWLCEDEFPFPLDVMQGFYRKPSTQKGHWVLMLSFTLKGIYDKFSF
jgi:hypothetical protein